MTSDFLNGVCKSVYMLHVVLWFWDGYSMYFCFPWLLLYLFVVGDGLA